MSGWFFDPLLPFCADVVDVDPPTEFKLRSENGNKKSASAQYDLMSWDATRTRKPRWVDAICIRRSMCGLTCDDLRGMRIKSAACTAPPGSAGGIGADLRARARSLRKPQ
ncbi:hypothetical protein ACVMHY_006320 [Bradyrhizobium barranii subsp. barranii]